MTPRVCWLAILLFIVVAYQLSISPRERAIAAAQERAEMLYERTDANTEIVRSAQSLQAARVRVIADVTRLRGEESPSIAMTRTIRLLDDEGTRYHVRIGAISPDAIPQLIASPGTAVTQSDPLTGQPLTISATGHFRDILTMLADLPDHDVLLAIDDAQLRTNDRAPSGSPDLAATLHATLYRLSPGSTDEVNHATTVVR